MKYELKMLVTTYLPTFGLLEEGATVLVPLRVARRWLEYGVAEAAEGTTVPAGDDSFYAPLVHTHKSAQVTDLTTVLDEIYAPEVHTHTAAQVTDLTTEMDLAYAPIEHEHTADEITDLTTEMDKVYTTINSLKYVDTNNKEYIGFVSEGGLDGILVDEAGPYVLANGVAITLGDFILQVVGAGGAN